MPTCGGLFDGAGLLACGLHLAGWEHAWLCESDPWRRELLSKRFPGIPVFGDVRDVRGPFAADARCARRPEVTRGTPSEQGTAIGRDGRGEPHADNELGSAGASELQTAAPVDLIAGGFPCKGASTAGKREGFHHAETVLWHEMRRCISELQPRYVLIENVANILGMAASPSEPPGSLWGTVLADLAALGFDVRWDCLPAAAIGAPHLRDRVFAVATQPAHVGSERTGNTWDGWPGLADSGSHAADAARESRQGTRTGREPLGRTTSGRGVAVEWGDYQPAITRWETIHGAAPQPLVRRLDDGDPQLRRMRARMDRSRLSALGDGVHVYVAWLAGTYIMDLATQQAAA